ncbi:hypothetical protein Pint_05921 [Pistacia integerrima]|uniref:Uncharacterized protein n=1 Tax=Pistacia integerrima TaxID=434235 RepID=A0ACC0Z860_9ROSI|nr:hypothetical protein Pint_05921 [Pistacia integerrima]
MRGYVRRFRIGTINGTKVIYVRCGIGLVNAAAATQQLADLFDITGIIHSGIAGNLNGSLSYGDVTILRRVANAAIFDWLNPNGTTNHTHITSHDLVIGTYNLPEGNETSNSLGRVGFRYERFLSESAEPNTDVETAWFNSTEEWFEVATKLETSSSNGFPVIVIRGLSDVAGNETVSGSEIEKYRDIAAHNTVKVVLEYIYYLCKGTDYRVN